MVRMCEEGGLFVGRPVNDNLSGFEEFNIDHTEAGVIGDNALPSEEHLITNT